MSLAHSLPESGWGAHNADDDCFGNRTGRRSVKYTVCSGYSAWPAHRRQWRLLGHEWANQPGHALLAHPALTAGPGGDLLMMLSL